MAAPTGTSATLLIHEYLIEEDEMGDSTAQSLLLDYLVAVLRWLYRAEGWFVARDLTLYHPAIRNRQHMISPDIAVFTGIPLTPDEQWALTSWDMRPRRRAGTGGAGRPCPPVIIEVSSGSTWATDIGAREEDKPWIYGLIGVREYFAFDPNRPPVWRRQGGRRLLGWRYDAARQPIALAPDARGWLWSAELESWLAADVPLLRLYDPQGQPRLTEAEAMEVVLQDTQTQAERERRALQDAQAQAEQDRRALQEAEERLAALRDVLRAHNIDPDRL